MCTSRFESKRVFFMIYNLDPAIGFRTKRWPDDKGYDWTLTTILGRFLNEAEELYGPRDKEWTPLGIEFAGDVPKVWFPRNGMHISIVLTESAASDPQEAIFELAHEVIHLLAPTHETPTIILEEGLATYFAHQMCAKYAINRITTKLQYLDAEAKVKSLMQLYPDCIRMLRKIQPTFILMNENLIRTVCPNTPASVSKILTEKFKRDEV